MNQQPPVPPRYYGNVQPVAPVPVPAAVNDSGAIASLVCGLAAWVVCGFLTGIPAVILGHSSLKKIGRSGGYLKGKEIAFAGLVLGYLSCAAWLMFFVVIVVLVHQAGKEIKADEAGARDVIRQINEAEATYSTIYARSATSRSYAGSLATLGPGRMGTCSGTGTAEYACLLSGPLAAADCREPNWCVLGAYKFQLQTHVYAGPGGVDYVITAIPT